MIIGFLLGLLIGWFWSKHYFTKGEGKPLPENKDWDMYSGGH